MLTCVTDLAFGDTGKGKIVDAIAHEYDVVVRYNGGPNAGHTIVVDGNKFSFHNLPSAMFVDNPPDVFVLSGGMVVNPVSLMLEIHKYKHKISNLILSDRIHCIMPWHIEEDIANSKDKIGTTGKGIGPCYADKANRVRAIRLGDLRNNLHKIETNEKIAYAEAAEFLDSYICDERFFLREQIKNGANILFESANGIHLDVDHGSYPYVTSSGCGPAYIPQSCGLPNLHLENIIGITKAYTTRVGNGVLPTEIVGPVAESIRKIGNEFGTTTGRTRRIGWLDLDLIVQGIGHTGATEIAIMHMDTLALACAENNLSYFYAQVDGQPKEFPIWKNKDIQNDRYAQEFLDFVEEYTGKYVTYLGTGRDRKDLVETQRKPLTYLY